jgi:hypothetical protein
MRKHPRGIGPGGAWELAARRSGFAGGGRYRCGSPIEGRDEVIRWSCIDGPSEGGAGLLGQFVAERASDSE